MTKKRLWFVEAVSSTDVIRSSVIRFIFRTVYKAFKDLVDIVFPKAVICGFCSIVFQRGVVWWTVDTMEP